MSPLPTYDVAVVGLGAMGSAALYQLARRGARAIGLDRFAPPHERGSSHGETRITRQAIGEGEAYVPLALRAHAIWRELEAATGETLLVEAGCLIISREDDQVERRARTGFIQRTIRAAERYGISHEVLNAAELAYRHPQFILRGDESAYFEPGAGYVLPERCIGAQIGEAERLGAQVRLGTVVERIVPEHGAVRIETSAGTLLAGEVIVSAGAWAGALLGGRFARLLEPQRQMLHWFAIEPDAVPLWERSPAYIWPHGESLDDFFYGFPALHGSASLKTANEQYDALVDPNDFDRVVSAAESRAMFEANLKGRLRGIRPDVVRSATCLYTVTPDSAFLIDRHPEAPRILVVSPCSGHGFKHSAAIGEAAAEIAITGRSTVDLSAFAVSRFDTAGGTPSTGANG
ncbi:N-methyl-L-tryptophan oxidase [Aquabacter cavernae]|uniref:N-methyl-L-tryptophan oxidase n=1 Tax=Aquabacter cavernae TaxID=2496029 RepID=UPI000F8DC399|nr:N-methyl-L-tryptophan oxidase [Aquabacter cavernae]